MYFSKIARMFVVLGLLCCLVPAAYAQDEVAGQVLARINQARAENGLPALARNPQLDAAAQAHANDLLKNGVSLGHRGSDGSNIRQRIARAGYGGSTVGENWAAYRTLDQIMNFWLNDPPHRENILKGKYREVGIGVATRANGGLIVITDFGAQDNAPEIAAPAAQPPNAPKKAKATATRAKPAAPKPTPVPTRKPTRKPTLVQVAQIAPTPTPEPTRLALAPAPKAPPKGVLHARGRANRLVLRGSATSAVGLIETNGDPLKMVLGGVLSVAGAIM